jgi:hypothetical protein
MIAAMILGVPGDAEQNNFSFGTGAFRQRSMRPRRRNRQLPAQPRDPPG